MEIKSPPLRFLHTADIHLEARFSGLPAKERRARRAGLRSTFKRLIDSALERQVEALLISGDLFDNPRPAADTVDFARAELGRLAAKQIKIFLIPGNHDYYHDDSVYARSKFPEQVHIFRDDQWQALPLRGNIVVYGLACREFSSQKNVLAELPRPAAGEKQLVLLHGSLDFGFYHGEQCYPFRRQDIDNGGFVYLALGHYHNSVLNPADKRAFYAGSPEGLNFSEPGERGALLVEVSADKPRVEKLPLSKYKYEELQVDCTMLESGRQVVEIIKAHTGGEKLLRVKLTGSPGPGFDPRVDQEELDAACFYLEIKDELSLPADPPPDDKTIKSLFWRRMLAAAATVDDEERRRLELATRLGMAALDDRL